MKLIDFDEKFNKKVAEMLEKHAGEHTEEEWEDAIAKAYEKFGDTYMGAIGMTPRQYFEKMTDSGLVETLKEYILQDVPVPDILCGELEKRGASEPLLALLHETDEELVHYALNLIGSDPRALPRYAEMLSEEEYDEHIKDALADLLKESADEAKERILPLVKTESKPYALEILSRCKQKDDRVFEALLSAFRTGEEEEVPLYAGYLAAYGDERALPALQEHIAREDIDFVTFQELKFAIEALGGEYTAQRDFSEDESYKKIMAAGAGTDIFGSKKNG
ncbi:MAG TPA: hypothetical protein H9741_06075 [Candidatus Borkfalkia faecipullorum]|uniref:Uncharacterized protein n=1 Tax=Candidatus Borkfalkia faecipullorum TaxID=2838510 RepID=A0A9D1V8A4_9FIRM|nr:hypothetical protein [Candidatus Borkfalkia faecipullorum]